MEAAATLIVWAGLAYAAIGLLIGIAFIVRGVDRVDTAARGSGWGFKLLILPGAAALWPWTISLWRKNTVAAEGAH